MGERINVISVEELNKLERFNAVAPGLILGFSETMEREKAEKDLNYRQIIPYVSLINLPENKILVYRRAGSEERLKGQFSIGFGGHMRVDETIYMCIWRELNEELGLDIRPSQLDFRSVILLSDTEVDRVHIGLSYMVYLDGEPELHPSEEIAELWWEDLDNLDAERFENWSAYVIREVIHEWANV